MERVNVALKHITNETIKFDHIRTILPLFKRRKHNLAPFYAVYAFSALFFCFVLLLPRPKTLFLERYYFHRRVG